MAGGKERTERAKQREFLCEHLSFAGKEAYKRLRTNLQFSFPDGEEAECHVVGITSSQPAEGKSMSLGDTTRRTNQKGLPSSPRAMCPPTLRNF